MVDVVISGGGIAGSSIAILLGRQGLTVELFEHGQFPKEKPCGEGLMPGGVAVLDRLGLSDAVGGAPFYGVRYHFGDRTAEGRFPNIPGFPASGFGQRRKHLDHVLFQAAASTPGVTVHCGVQVDGPLIENERVVGLLVEGEPRRAKLVVAADGLHSRIRRQLGLEMPVSRKRLGARAHFLLAPGQEQPPWVDVFVRAGHELYVTPLPQREILVAALADGSALGDTIDRAFAGWVKSEPELAARLQGAEQVTSLLCTSPLSGRARAGFARGVVLLGDAAGFLDPITGGGMTQALMTAELLAGYMRRGFDTIDDCIGAFDRDRRSMLRDYQRLTRMVLWLADHFHWTEQFISVLRLSPALLSHLIGVSAGMSPLFWFGGSRVSRTASS
jgi:2-polyprenyl-6-methoxyphenol hydroxylase-like FAD-dependent oxidoreductase